MKCPKCNHSIIKIPLTKKMNKVFSFINDFIKNHGESPSFDEIKKGTDLNNKSEVARYVMNLENRGWISKERYKKRTIQVL